MPEIEIRPAVSADIPSLLQLEHDFKTSYVWQMERQFLEGQVTINFREIRLPRTVRVEYPHSRNGFTEHWKEYSAVIVAVHQGEPVAYINIVEQTIPATGWVTDLVVRDNLRRQGVGTALILAAERWAQQHKLRNLTLEMQSKNFPAIRLAMKLGFEFTGFNDHFYKNQDIALFFTRYLK